jgi:hypothetical protein
VSQITSPLVLFVADIFRFLADLTFYLESGLEIRVPNDQYVVPFVDIDTDGSRVIDTSKRDILMKGIEDEVPTLGRYFLTAAYLMVNHDAGTFTLWKVNATEESNPVRVFDEEAIKQCGDKATGVIQPSAYRTASASGISDPEGDTDDSKSKSSPSGAVIGGAVASAITGAALIGVGVVYLLYQKRTRASKWTTEYEYEYEGIELTVKKRIHTTIILLRRICKGLKYMSWIVLRGILLSIPPKLDCDKMMEGV